MREIKFRAWSNDNMCWCGAFSIHKTGMISDLIDAEIDKDSGNAISDAHWNENDLILMQYTGLKDKNGVEIYEDMELDDNFEVSFKGGCYILTNISNGDIILLYNYLKDKNGQVEITKEYTKI